jgi:hypothetical protein
MNLTSDAVIVKAASKPPDWKNGLPTMEDVGGAVKFQNFSLHTLLQMLF